ncbi:MAG: hypothetical protein M0T77_10170 [Actinomycetota bacterium]|nr:hypothetical protein [Actinomycetota bacterium]
MAQRPSSTGCVRHHSQTQKKSAVSGTRPGNHDRWHGTARCQRSLAPREPQLADDRRQAVADRITRGTIAASTLLLLLETRAGRELRAADPEELPLLWITERAERRALDLQRQLRAAHQHLGVAVEALAPLGSLA